MPHYFGPTNDPVRDAENYDRDQQARLEARPVCDWCGEPIQSNLLWDINGTVYCKGCIDSFQIFTEEYMEI